MSRAHEMHDVELGDGWYLAPEHTTHLVASAARSVWVPAGHDLQAVAPVFPLYQPGAQGAHVEPVWYLPTGHMVHPIERELLPRCPLGM